MYIVYVITKVSLVAISPLTSHVHTLTKFLWLYESVFCQKKSILADFCLIFRPRKLRQVAAELNLFLQRQLVVSDPRKKYVVCRTLPQASGINFVKPQK